MKKFDMWCLKHKLLAFILMSVVLCGIITAINCLIESSITTIVVMDALAILLSAVYPSSCYATEFKKRVEPFYNCYPQPLYEIAEEIKPYLKGISLQEVLLNQASALFAMGEHEKMLSLMESINIDKYAGFPLQFKVLYYNNLASAYEISGQLDKAAFAYQKLKTILADANDRIKKQFLDQTLEPDIFEYKRSGDYKKALELCAKKSSEKPLQQVEKSYCMAELYISLGEIDEAKRLLSFVRANGGGTFFVKKSEEMLENLG